MTWYIHYDDPGFPDPPWPGQRRVGPFLTLEEARAQAVSDAATGYGIGEVFSEEASGDANANPQRAVGPPAVAKTEVQAASDKIVKRQVADALKGRADDDAALATVLPQGITVADLRKEGLLP